VRHLVAEESLEEREVAGVLDGAARVDLDPTGVHPAGRREGAAPHRHGPRRGVARVGVAAQAGRKGPLDPHDRHAQGAPEMLLQVRTQLRDVRRDVGQDGGGLPSVRGHEDRRRSGTRPGGEGDADRARCVRALLRGVVGGRADGGRHRRALGIRELVPVGQDPADHLGGRPARGPDRVRVAAVDGGVGSGEEIERKVEGDETLLGEPRADCGLTGHGRGDLLCGTGAAAVGRIRDRTIRGACGARDKRSREQTDGDHTKGPSPLTRVVLTRWTLCRHVSSSAAGDPELLP